MRMRGLEEGFDDLHVVRVRARVTAYIYGNILVLGTLAELSDADVEDGRAVVKVTVVTVTTFLAHVLASTVAERVDRTPEDHREHASQHLADAVPILVSGIAPCLVLALGQWELVDLPYALALATLIPVVRLAGTGSKVAWLTHEPSSRFITWSGLVLAAGGLGIALLKLVG